MRLTKNGFVILILMTGSSAFAKADFVVLYPKTPAIPRTLQRVTEPLVIEKKEPVIGPLIVLQSGRCVFVSAPANSGR